MKKYKVLFVFALIALAGAFFFFYRMYHKDVKALENFSASYETFDKAISDFSVSNTNDLEKKAADALNELIHATSFKLSSLIKNDSLIPPLALEIADLSRKELDILRAYKRAIQNKPPHQNLDCAKRPSVMVEIWCGGKDADVDALAKEYGNLIGKRKTAYTRFRELLDSTHLTLSAGSGSP